MARAMLTRIGFTDLESDIYVTLLRMGAMTGYAVAKEIGKAVANVYKGLESLADKGAVIQSQSDRKLFRAVPWRQLLAEEERRHRQTIESLADELEAIPEPDEDEEVYQLKNVDQVIAEGIRIIDEAEHVVLADLEPASVPAFSKALENAAARGVEVRVKVYRPATLEGVNVIGRRKGEEVFERTKDVHFKITADGRAFLNALLNISMDSVIQAFRSSSALMNISIHSGLLYELILTDLKPAIEDGDIEKARALIEETRHLHPFSGHGRVLETYAERYDFAR